MQIGAAVVVALILGALLLAPQPLFPWRLLIAALTLAFAWRPLHEVVYARGPRAVRRARCAADGWRLELRAGCEEPARLLRASGCLGPWIFLFWASERGTRHAALVDARYADPRIFRALKGRLRLGVAQNPHPPRADGGSC